MEASFLPFVLHTHTHTHIYIYIYICVCVFVVVYMCLCVFVCVYVRVCMCLFIFVDVSLFIFISFSLLNSIYLTGKCNTGLILSEVHFFWFQSFSSPSSVALPKSNRTPVLLTITRTVWRNGFMHFPIKLVWTEVQTAAPRIWILSANSYDDNHYATGASTVFFYMYVLSITFTQHTFQAANHSSKSPFTLSPTSVTTNSPFPCVLIPSKASTFSNN